MGFNISEDLLGCILSMCCQLIYHKDLNQKVSNQNVLDC